MWVKEGLTQEDLKCKRTMVYFREIFQDAVVRNLTRYSVYIRSRDNTICDTEQTA